MEYLTTLFCDIGHYLWNALPTWVLVLGALVAYTATLTVWKVSRRDKQ